MKVLIVQHVKCEGSGYIEDFLRKEEIDFAIARMYEGEGLPIIDEFGAVIVLGGPMNVY